MIKIWAEPKGHEFFLGEFYPLKQHEIWYWIRSNNKQVQEWIDGEIHYKGTIPHTIYMIFNENPKLVLSGKVLLELARTKLKHRDLNFVT